MATSYLPGGLPPPPSIAGAALPYGAVPPPMPPYGAALLAAQQQRMVVLKKPQFQPTVVVLTNVPSFLSHSRNLRDWVYTVGAHARAISYSRDNRSREYYNSSTHLYLKHKTLRDPTEEQISTNNSSNTVAVIRMSHSTGAYHVCRFWELAKQRLINDLQQQGDTHVPEMNAYLLVTTSADQYLPIDPMHKDTDREFVDTFVLPSMYGDALTTAASFLVQPLPTIVPPGFVLPPVDGITLAAPALLQSDTTQVPPSPQEVEESLVLKLMEAYTAIRLKQETMDLSLSTATQTTDTVHAPNNPELDNTTDLDFKETEDPSSNKLDVQKVAAAAGGGMYDEDSDPLNAPAVLEAVAKFKRALEERDVTVKTKRFEYVDKKIRDFLGPARQRVVQRRLMEKEEEDKKRRAIQEAVEQERLRTMALAAGLPLPPLPTMMPPLPPKVPLPPVTDAGVVDSGRRGVSNLPSWMTRGTPANTSVEVEEDTKKRKMMDSYSGGTDDQDHPMHTRRQRVDMVGADMAQIRADNEAADAAIQNITDGDILNPSSSFPPMSVRDTPLVRKYVTEQIVKYLGEEEPTMIDFVMSHLQRPQDEERTTGVLLEELSLVLENDAQLFVVDLFRLLVSQWTHP